MQFIRLLLAFMVPMLLPLQLHAQTMPAIPPNILASPNLPMVMLTVAKDFTMFGRAYTDYEDIDFDGVVDYTYKPAFRYYGYFDSDKCYVYSSANGRFEPSGSVSVESGKLYCNVAPTTTQWSGNFLNWATMSRIDVLRKVLYGGTRTIDSASDTTLELSFVPRNSQAIAKYYNGADLGRLTPYGNATALAQGITLCRRPVQNTGVSHTALLTPSIRVAIGNLVLWNMTEVRTCNWDTEISYTWKAPTIAFLNSNYTTPAGTLGSNNADHAHKSKTPTAGDSYNARVRVCVAGSIGGERCKQYGSAWKPIGLLQEFGESVESGQKPARAEFGMVMGSYDNNLEAGRLRKNMQEINDEIDPTNGQYLTSSPGATRTYRSTNGGIISALDEITLYGYDVGGGSYDQTCYSDTLTNGNCSSWGNPIGEMLLESMLYYAGKAATVGSGLQTKDTAVGLPQVTTRRDPLVWDDIINAGKRRSALYGQNICRRLNMLTITGGINSFDDNGMGRFSELGSTATATARTNALGDLENVTGTTKLVGSNGTTVDNLCTSKTISSLGLVAGVCPDGPNFRGTYLGAGVAHYANTQRIRSDLNVTAAAVPDLPHTALTVKQYGVTMTGGVANIQVPVPGQPGKVVVITPASIDNQGGKTLPGNLVDFKVLQRAADGLSGAALVLWQHNMLGEDQDQDMLGTIRWSVDSTQTPPRLTVFTQTVEADTGSGAPFAFGYTLAGTTTDGAYFHSAINNYVSDATSVSTAGALYNGTDGSATAGQCAPVGGGARSLCVRLGAAGNYVRGETSRTYAMSGSTSAMLKEPLWYIAKYGGFDYTRADKTAAGAGELYPQRRAQWDRKRSDGAPCAGTVADPCDGDPDNYFVARRPDLLEASLREVFQDIVNTSNTAPAISSSQLRTGALKYSALFDPADGRGEVWAYELQASGNFSATPAWGAHTALTAANWDTGRKIITNTGNTGKAFRWGDLSAAQQGQLQATGTAAYGQALLNWLRGDTSDNSNFRKRATSSLMGAVVNSTPNVQGRPAADMRGSAFTGYGSFVSSNRTRASVLWVGAGDGMLHAFDASLSGNGAPLLSYVPGLLFPRLRNWALPDTDKVQAFADGSPITADVQVSSSWRTYLFSTLGRGGKGVFALDVTDPSTFNEANAASIFRWQFSEADDTSGDLGFIISDPSISRFSEQAGAVAKLNNGKFALLLGNGYFSTNGSAVLYILFVDGPGASAWSSASYIKLVADVGPNNGLSAPTWVDTNGDGVADVVYAGDLKGNVWKFDLSSSTASSWAVAYSGKPLYVASDANARRLAITTAVETRAHPLGGLLVTFGTGRALLAGEFSGNAERHGVFGIWDKPSFASVAAASLDTTLPRGIANLASRTLTVVDTAGNRVVGGSAIDWSTQLGWQMPLPATDEMTLSNPARLLQSLVITSMAPPAAKANNTDPDACWQRPRAWLNAIDPVTGLTAKPVLGTVTYLAGGVSTTVPLTSRPVDDSKFTFGADKTCSDAQNCGRAVGATSDVRLTGSQDRGRLYWREVPGLRTLGN